MCCTLSSAFAQAPARLIDRWSGLIIDCKIDAGLIVPTETCANILKTAGEAAAAAKVKFIGLDATDSPADKARKVAAAGFDEAKAGELQLAVRKASSSLSAATLDMKVASRLNPISGARTPQSVQIFSLDAQFDQQPIWVLYIQPFAKQMIDIFFERAVAPPR